MQDGVHGHEAVVVVGGVGTGQKGVDAGGYPLQDDAAEVSLK